MKTISEAIHQSGLKFEQRVATNATTGHGCEKHFGVKHKCWTCHDIRYIGKAVPVSHPDFGKAYPCPNCNGGTANIDTTGR